MKKEIKFLAGIIILGVLLRCLELNSRSIQYDDAFSILLSGRNLNEIISGTAADTMPPLFYFILQYTLGLFSFFSIQDNAVLETR